MNKPIINPATLSEEQREAIRELYANCININALIRKQEKFNPNKNKVITFRTGAMAAMTKLFGSEFFKSSTESLRGAKKGE